MQKLYFSTDEFRNNSALTVLLSFVFDCCKLSALVLFSIVYVCIACANASNCLYIPFTLLLRAAT